MGNFRLHFNGGMSVWYLTMSKPATIAPTELARTSNNSALRLYGIKNWKNSIKILYATENTTASHTIRLSRIFLLFSRIEKHKSPTNTK